MNDLDKLREIFLSGNLDDEDYQDNVRKITEWETGLRSSEDFLSWQLSDVTKSIVIQAKQSYRDNAARLMTDRTLSEQERMSIWAKQDAIVYLMSLVDKDARGDLEFIQRAIKTALTVN